MTAPTATAAITARSTFRMGSCSTRGPSRSRYKGEVSCRKMAFADVVSLFAATNRTIVAAYAAPIIQTRHVHRVLAEGSAIESTAAAIPDRNPATCQLVSEEALIAAPPVENSSAAAISISRLVVALDKLQGNPAAMATI